jgi:hypothetical protein
MARPQTIIGVIDDTLPLTCVIESSQLVEGHGVMSHIKVYFSNKY